MNKIKYQTIRLSPFPFDVIVFYGSKREKVIEWAKETIPEQFSENHEMYEFNGVGRSIMTDGGWTILWTKEKDIPILTHEIFHVCEFLFRRIGIEYNIGSGELWAYMSQYIMSEILKNDEK